MPRSRQVVEFNNFVGGIVTEASPLTFPDNASIDEQNFILNEDGSRRRRLGMDYEANHSWQGVNLQAEAISSSFRWENAGGDGKTSLMVVQVGETILIYGTNGANISGNYKYSYQPDSLTTLRNFSYATVDGKLVVATGGKDVLVFNYDISTESVTSVSKVKLLVRDSFGVADVLNGEDLLEGIGLSRRPARDGAMDPEVLTEEHTYNLRNQTWAAPRAKWPTHDANVFDPMDVWKSAVDSLLSFPSNSDSVVHGLYTNPTSDNSVILRLNPDTIRANPAGSFRAPTGHFIIDLLERGSSRLEEEAKLRDLYPELVYTVANLPLDKTPNGPSAITQYAGRVWYAGFSGEVEDGDTQSPNLSSYIAYSVVVKSQSDINKCYQVGDPTSEVAPDLLDTDGGFLKIDSAYNIQTLVSVGSGLLVVAENGVWMVRGGTDKGFTANSQIVTKITEHGTTAPTSVVVVDNTVMYWSDDGIYQVGPNEYGDWDSTPISTKIKKLYQSIGSEAKTRCVGIFDSYDRKVRWLYDNTLTDTPAKELVLDVTLGAFSSSVIAPVLGGFPKVLCPIESPPFTSGEEEQAVVHLGEEITYLGEPVVYTTSVRQESIREVMYYTARSHTPGLLTLTFSNYSDDTFTDWKTFDGVGVDAEAYLVTGYVAGGDYQRSKQAGYVTFHFRRTEDGFEDSTGVLLPTNQSSCLVQAQWGWANSEASGKWGRSFQAYRYRKHYTSSGVGDTYDYGFGVITSKSKLRGSGKVVSLLIKSEPGKDLDLLGWGMTVEVRDSV